MDATHNDDGQVGRIDDPSPLYTKYRASKPRKRIVFKAMIPIKLCSDCSEQGLPLVYEARYVSDAPRPLVSRFPQSSLTKTPNLSLVHQSTEATTTSPPTFEVYSSRVSRQQLYSVRVSGIVVGGNTIPQAYKYSDGIKYITKLLQRTTRRMSGNTVRRLAQVQSLQRSKILCLVRRRQMMKYETMRD